MKKLTLLLLLFNFITIYKSEAQIPMCYKGHFYVYKYDGGLGNYYNVYQSIQCDTTIDSKSYYKVLDCDQNGNNSTYRGAIREDSITQKVYFVSADSLYERLVFDFSLQANDTFYYSSPTWSKNVHVDSVNTKLLYGQNRKVIYFDSIPPFIEGIGSQFWGLLDRPFAQTGFYATTKIIDAFNVPEQCYPTYIQDLHTSDINIIIYPSPVQNELNIHLNQETNGQILYLIANVQGQVILKGPLNAIHSKLQLQTLNSGLYILKVQTKTKSYNYPFYKE